jgi:hypothetical protein
MVLCYSSPGNLMQELCTHLPRSRPCVGFLLAVSKIGSSLSTQAALLPARAVGGTVFHTWPQQELCRTPDPTSSTLCESTHCSLSSAPSWSQDLFHLDFCSLQNSAHDCGLVLLCHLWSTPQSRWLSKSTSPHLTVFLLRTLLRFPRLLRQSSDCV